LNNMADYNFGITLEGFNDGLGPLAHIDSDTYLGSPGQASGMKADIISMPGFIRQSPDLANLTNGTQAGEVDELIRFILDRPTASDTTYAIGETKLFKLSSSTVSSGGSPSWPQTVADMTDGESVIRLKANLYGFYNKASGGDILQMPLATETIDPDWGSSNDAALQDALHPVAAKEDIMVFGNGRYVGAYVEGSSTLDVQKLDFGEGAEVADIVFNSNVWYIAVNYGEGRRGQIYLYDGSAISNVLSDEAGLGSQKIGFLFVQNSVVYVAYQDNSTGYFTIGWMSGRQLKPLRYFSGALPDHRQKTLYKNTILFVSDDSLYSCGASVEQLPVQISRHADAGYGTVGGLAAPFGTPMVASTDGATNYRLAKFNGLSTDSNWKSVLLDVTDNRMLGKITCVIVATKSLSAGARIDLSLEGNQGDVTSSSFQITGAGETRHVFRSIDLKACEDVRVVLDATNGHASNPCDIRKITLLGNFVER
jgi:hypothetical protein